MTLPVGCWARLSRARGVFNQILIVMLINVPTVSFGLALGWVSLASGEAGDEAGDAGGEAGRGAVVAAVTTFVATLAGVPLSARALAAGRKLAIIATSGAFVVCWSLKLASAWGGPWCVVSARVAAGLGGAAAWALAPLLAREVRRPGAYSTTLLQCGLVEGLLVNPVVGVLKPPEVLRHGLTTVINDNNPDRLLNMCGAAWRGAAVAALALAHNVGVLLMYLAADARLPHGLVLWCCLALSVLHCIVFFFMPESPSFLAAKGKIKEARLSLAWLRGLAPQDPALDQEMEALPQPELHELTPFKLAKEMLSDARRRRAFFIGGAAVVGQEACGVLAILQYAERVFVLAREQTPAVVEGDSHLASPSRHAVLLGTMQLVASALALYLVERVGRRPLIVWCAVGTGVSLAVATWLVSGSAGSASGAAIALAVAVGVDSAGLQPAPYSLLADMFDYEYRGCALMLISALACAGNAIEVVVFPVVAAYGGLVSALGLAAGLTLAYAVFAAIAIPETKGRTPDEIYDAIGPKKTQDVEDPKQIEKTKDVNKTDKVESDAIRQVKSETVKVNSNPGLLTKNACVVSEETRCTRL